MNFLSGSLLLRASLFFFLLYVLNPLVLAQEKDGKREFRGLGTVRMAERLQRIAEQVNPMRNPFLSTERAKILEPILASTTDTQRRGELSFLLASQLLNAGRNAEALNLFQGLEQLVKTVDPQAFLRNRTTLGIKEALCWMRIGEMTNCLADHNPESCLAPIQEIGRAHV